MSNPQRVFRRPPLFPWWTWVLSSLTVVVIVGGVIALS